jgi:hypothetical protein
MPAPVLGVPRVSLSPGFFAVEQCPRILPGMALGGCGQESIAHAGLRHQPLDVGELRTGFPIWEERVRRTLVIAAIVAAALVISAGSAQASTKWPARCGSWKCVNAHLNALHTQQTALKKGLSNLSWVNPCLDNIIPMTDFNGYLFDDGAGGSFDTTAFDYTLSGEVADFWMLTVDPTCAPPTARPVIGRHTFHVLPRPAPSPK